MSSHKLRLNYFDAAGRAEAIRIALFMSGVSFEDHRIAYADWGATEKAKQPLGNVPTLEVEGGMYTQSLCLARYAARLGPSGLYPDGIDGLKTDEIMTVLEELLNKAPQNPDKELKKQARIEYEGNLMKKYFTMIEKRIVDNGSGFVAGKGLTLGDLFLHAAVNGIRKGDWDYINTSFFDNYPAISACVKKVDEHEKILAYYAAHPKKTA